MENIIALCRCIKSSPNKDIIEFHFKGVFAGNKIKKILVRYNGKEAILPNDDYLLCIGNVSVKNDVLMGQIWRIKKLDDIYSY